MLLHPPDLALEQRQQQQKIQKLKLLLDFLSEVQQKVTTNPLLGDLHSVVSEVQTLNRPDFPVSELRPLELPQPPRPLRPAKQMKQMMRTNLLKLRLKKYLKMTHTFLCGANYSTKKARNLRKKAWECFISKKLMEAKPSYWSELKQTWATFYSTFW